MTAPPLFSRTRRGPLEGSVPRRRPRWSIRDVVWGLAAALVCSAPAMGQWSDDGWQDEPLSTRVWLDRGDDPVLERGDEVRLYYRASHDAFIALFHIDTNGTVRMVYPRSPEENHYVRGGRDFRLVFPESSYWRVTDDPGVGYYFSVASPEPFDFRDFRYSPYSGGWDLSAVGRQVFDDPYVAMDHFVERLVPDWQVVPYALDFSSYHVEQRYEYPRFLCYDCHGFRPYQSWDPYLASCTSFRVVVYSDPYYYPATRYRGTNVVYLRPEQPGTPRFEFKERGRGEAAAPLVIERNAVPRSTASPSPTPSSVRVAPSNVAPSRVAPSGVRAPTGGAIPSRSRPSSVLPPTSSGPDRSARPTLERRPSSGVGAPTRSAPPTAVPTRGSPPPSSATPTRGAPPPTAGPTPTRGSPPPSSATPTRSSPPPSSATPTRSSPPPTAGPTPTRSSPPPTARPTRSGGGGGGNPPTSTRSTPPNTTRSGGGGGGGGGSAQPTRSAPPPAATPTRRSSPPPAASSTRSGGGGGGSPPTRTPPPTRRGGGGGGG